MRLHNLKKHGFTLTELAIVLGVMGIILGAIWVAASKVYQNNRVQIAVRDTETIVQGYRSLFTTHPVDISDWTDITCMGVNSGFFPNDMLFTNTTCSTGAYTTTYPQHPWNSYVLVQSVESWQAISVTFYNLTQASCNQLSQQLFSAPDIVSEGVNNTDVVLPPIGNQTAMTESQIAADCVNSNSNSIYVALKAR